ncbi:CLUMA_CG008202, isoform A [Clunio marinus]|uniref:CLUMA_CG008202, isoform A n=1 Tax=Clunio marinus TaxID=568069 RepID=A0A1J1I6X5_9DIPT|nr:CLUMA_CG008202, isoform A [Clunio marinus]
MKNRAVSLAMTGTRVGQVLLPQVIKLLMPLYGSKGTLLIFAGLALNGVFGALLFHPIHRHATKFNTAFEWCLIKDLRFYILNIGLSSGDDIIVMDASMVLSLLLQKKSKLTTTQTALCLSLLAISNIVSRLTFHFISDLLKLSCRMTFSDIRINWSLNNICY